MARLDEMYERMQKIKKEFEGFKKIFEDRNVKIDEIRKHHEEEMKNIFEAFEKRDEEIKKYIEQREQAELGRLIEELGFLIDEMFSERLKLLEEREAWEGKKGKKD